MFVTQFLPKTVARLQLKGGLILKETFRGGSRRRVQRVCTPSPPLPHLRLPRLSNTTGIPQKRLWYIKCLSKTWDRVEEFLLNTVKMVVWWYILSGVQKQKKNPGFLPEIEFTWQTFWEIMYRKIPNISPGAYIFQRPFLRCLFLGGLIFAGAYLRRGICVSKLIRLVYSWK